MIALPSNLDLNAQQAAAEAQRAREEVGRQGEVLLKYLNQIRASHELGATSITTTCMTHELEWLAEELRQRQFTVTTEVHLMHGQITIEWPETPSA